MSNEPHLILRPLAKLVAPHQQGDLLEALLTNVSDEEVEKCADRVRLRTPGHVSPSELLLQEAARVLPKAAGFLRRSPVEVRRRLGGCSLELVSLAAQQALAVYETEKRRARDEAERVRQAERMAKVTVTPEAVENAKARAKRARRAGAKMCAELQLLLEKVDPEVTHLAVSSDESDPELVARALERFADEAARLLQQENPAVRARAMLFGLDGLVAQSWRHEAVALREAVVEHEELLQTSRRRSPQEDLSPLDDHELRWGIGTAVILLGHIVEAFVGGNRTERRIPKLHSTLYAPSTRRRGRRTAPRA